MEYSIKIKNNVYNSLEEFAKNMYLFPNESYSLIKSKKFLNYLYKFNENMYNSVGEILSKKHFIDECVFKVSLILNPLMGLRYHGYLFNDFESLGRKIISFGPGIDIYLKDFLKYKLLSYYMKITKYDEKMPDLYAKVLELEAEFINNENRAYFKLGFILMKDLTLTYSRKKFVNAKEFLAYVLQPVIIQDFALNFISSQYVFAWLELLGYSKEIVLFENLVNSIEQKEKLNDNFREV